ncbi:oxidoreductase [Polaribacter reichenbachii]|uniref:Oxidoreductase n=1 Tax=Polaribacter reichenbachii TaxID=996801 RepID=A0A1B8U1P7_9FLAO|nr:oxidoreductase [Polaribacter reichenbachii]APZ47283.1 oxidoreductase [Polaribacter reichenbachii]AUC17924.1 oxidoreductase [Polaribacter reichenbachii]OBY65751.1 oxidoreductase [Polaribacter reichenbachii]
MKRITLLFFAFLLIYSCAKEYIPRNIDTIQIQEFKIDSTSIRAIKVVDTEKVYYAGSKGNVGFKTDKDVSLNALNIKYKDSIIPNFRSVAFNGDDYFALSIGNPALLYKISQGKSTIVYKEEHEKVFYDALTFFDDNIHGIAVGDPTENCASIILTSDAGKTWKKLACKNLPKFEEGEAFFAASNTNIKTIDNTVWIASGGKKARILKSTDFGQTWQIYNTPIIQGNGPQGIYSIDFADKNNGIIIGGDYSKPQENKATKAITKDGGKTWTLIADNQNPNYKSCVQYVPNTNGKEIFAVGKTGISFSNDAGKTWKDVSNDSYYAIQFVDKNTAWLSGNEKIGKLILE